MKILQNKSYLIALDALKVQLKSNWLLWMLTLLALRPKQFMIEYIYSSNDYRLFRDSLKPYRAFLSSLTNPPNTDSPGNLLIVAGRSMNVQWLQIWAILSAALSIKGCQIFAITTRGNLIQNLYLKLFNITLIHLEDMCIDEVSIPANIALDFKALESFSDFKQYEYKHIPIGKMALSTFSRIRATGIMDVADQESRQEILYWLEYLYKMIQVADLCYKKNGISILFFTEVFMEEYGALYYAALKEKLNIIRFAGTVRDNAIVAQHLNTESDRTHFASISTPVWEQILSYPDTPSLDRELEQNFHDRYSDRWALSKRNQPNTQIMSVEDARKLLGIPGGCKVGIIYSHILYDTLFFNGEDLFDNYADWLIRSVEAACANPQLQWFIKIHPSNLWRGELEHYHGGKYEEVRLIESYIGKLPNHVKLIYPDTPLSPYTWLQLADFGITVRGTSGIELGALGKTVITAGSGRYENIGFTLNPASINEYLELLARLPDVPNPTEAQKRLGKRFAYATFCMKPITLEYLEPVTRSGRLSIFSSDDLVFRGNFPDKMSNIPESIEHFTSWCLKKDSIDFLNPWPLPSELSSTDLPKKTISKQS